MREARQLGIKESFSSKIAAIVCQQYGEFYPELQHQQAAILAELEREEEQFSKTLENGTREFNKLIARIPDFVTKKQISGKNAFNLYETYGFPLELTVEMAAERGFVVDEAGFQKAYEKHQELSRAGAEQKFKGGLADQSENTTALHTATHLLHKALRLVLGEHVEQSGSNITAERLRFDFSHPEKMSKEQLAEVERIVNEQISKDLPVTWEEVSLEEAKKRGAIGLFEDRYGDLVKLYRVGDFSMEICGGPHVSHTGALSAFKIVKEESSSRGVRRIKAVLK